MPRCCCICTPAMGRPWYSACEACSPSRSGMTSAVNCSWRVISTGSSPSTLRMTAGHFVSRLRSRRCSLAGGISRDPEPAGLAGFYLFGNVPEPFTLYREIRALPAGHTQIIDAGGPREPRPFASIAAVLADGARARAPARRTRGTGACRRARQRPGAPARGCRDRHFSVGRDRLGSSARTAP